MRLRRFSAPRSFFVAAAVGGLIALAQPSTASACSPEPSTPNVYLAPRGFVGMGPLSVPKSAGLVFTAQLHSLSEDAAKALVSIEVRSGDAIIPGTLQSVGKVVNANAWWRWLPDGETELPTGELAIEITIKGAQTKNDTVTVDDRGIEHRAPTFTVSAARQLVADATAPMISCQAPAIANCGGFAASQVSTRAIAQAQVGVTLSADEQDKPYFQPAVRVFGRSSGDTTVTKEASGWGTVFGRLEGEFDEFCAEVTTLSLIDGSEITTNTTCIENTLDLGPVPSTEANAFVKKNLESCSEPTYPPGTSAENPTGQTKATAYEGASPESSAGGADGCSAAGTTRTTPRSNGFVAALAVGLCALAGRRSRRR